jgi:hypothetical protein
MEFMKVRRILASLGAGLLMSGALVALTAQAADAATLGEYRPLVNAGSGKCLTIQPNAYGYLDNGLRVMQAPCDGSFIQKWRFIQTGTHCVPVSWISGCSFSYPIYWVQNQDTLKCMDLNNGSSSNGTPVQQWDCVDNSNMKWAFNPFNPQGNFNLTNERAGSGTCLDVTNGSTADFALLQGWHCFDYPNNLAQMFYQL